MIQNLSKSLNPLEYQLCHKLNLSLIHESNHWLKISPEICNLSRYIQVYLLTFWYKSLLCWTAEWPRSSLSMLGTFCFHLLLLTILPCGVTLNCTWLLLDYFQVLDLNPGRPCLTLDSFGSIPNSGQQRLACSNLVFLHQLGKYFENLLQRALLQM